MKKNKNKKKKPEEVKNKGDVRYLTPNNYCKQSIFTLTCQSLIENKINQLPSSVWSKINYAIK